MMSLFSCDRIRKEDKQIYMVNNSSSRVVYMSSNSYPDTLNFMFNGCSTKDIGNIVSPGESKSIRLYSSWEKQLDEVPSKTIMFFVYNADSAGNIADNKIGCDSLRKRPDLILKRFDVDINYLNQQDWKLAYAE
jgi:hypothetical protein